MFWSFPSGHVIKPFLPVQIKRTGSAFHQLNQPQISVVTSCSLWVSGLPLLKLSVRWIRSSVVLHLILSQYCRWLTLLLRHPHATLEPVWILGASLFLRLSQAILKDSLSLCLGSQTKSHIIEDKICPTSCLG
ncbi:hypothetical protein HJG60_009271 [Phyllostomus discolor]|uniref:Uncharacterized protein n=1 Tax=Phyllostomus discolor TaxID=89673 RepID=A0A833YQA5_9CHIR|nr:hypothetical protein HJG60_009271 [Phyllostomus discolor]